VRLLKEANAAGDYEWSASSRELHLNVHRVEVGAIKDGDIGVASSTVNQSVDAIQDIIRLLVSIYRRDENGEIFVWARWFEDFSVATVNGSGFKNVVGQFENLGRASIVRLNLVNGGVWVPLREVENLIKVRSSPGVNALSVITDCHDLVIGGYLVDYAGLEDVNVLVFIHQNVAEAILVVSRSFIVAFENL
jgi:hypothetical protein